MPSCYQHNVYRYPTAASLARQGPNGLMSCVGIMRLVPLNALHRTHDDQERALLVLKIAFLTGAVSCMQGQAHMRLQLNPSYPVLEYELASALHCVINGYWQRMQRDPNFRPTVQVPPRALFAPVSLACMLAPSFRCSRQSSFLPEY